MSVPNPAITVQKETKNNNFFSPSLYDNYISIMTSPQKAKGNAWERKVAEHLTALYGEKFIRVPHSGAYIGGSNAHRKEYLHEGQIRSFKGDIVPGQSFPKFNAECKSYKDFPFHQLFQGSCKQLDEWIEQTMDVADTGDFNIVFMKFNRKGTFVAVHLTDTKSISLNNHFIYTTEKYGSWAIMEYEQFWDANTAAVRELCK